MAGTLITDSLSQLQEQRLSAIAMSLTHFDSTAVSEIAAGSMITISGSVIKFEAEESMGSNWAAMAAGVVYAYINGTTYASTYTETAPTWSEEKQGHYDATFAHRYYAKLVKDGSANYTQKTLYSNIKNVSYSDKGLFFNQNVFNSLIGNNITYNTVFDTLAPYIPNVDDKIIIHGGFKYDGGDSEVAVYAIRYSSTHIYLWHTKYSFCDLVDGSTTHFDEVIITW